MFDNLKYIYCKLALDKKVKCDEDQILLYLAKLQVINPEGILLIASYKDIEYFCRFVGHVILIKL